MRLFALSLVVCLGYTTALFAEDSKDESAEKTTAEVKLTLAEQLKAAPDDVALFQKYLTSQQREIMSLTRSDAEKAEEKIAAMKTLIESLEIEERQTVRAKRVIDSLEIQIEMGRVTFEQATERLKADPENTRTVNLYRSKLIMEIMMNMRTNPEKTEKLLAEAEAMVTALGEENEDTQKRLTSIQQLIAGYQRRMAVERMTLEEVAAKVEESPGDAQHIAMYQTKLGLSVSSIARSEPERANEMMSAAKELVAKLTDLAESDEAKQAVEQLESSFARLDKQVAAGMRLAALIGSDAAPMDIQAWVNGDPISDDELKGKVVMLDFWAVWCGPCVMTFPHLREWDEKYADQGLEIIGLTSYYGYTWDEEAGRPKRSSGEEKPTPEEEQEMLAKFAEQHKLPYRLAIPEDRSLSQYYAVTGIPHVVIIDRTGKIRLVRVGAGEASANAISEMLEKLFAEEDVDTADATEAEAATSS